MKVQLPKVERWTPEFQRSHSAEIERALNRLNEFAQLRAGGAAGQVLAKASGKDYDVAWSGGTAWQDVNTFLNGWTHYDAAQTTYSRAGYMKDMAGIVRLRGLIRLGTVGQPAFALPTGFQPEHEKLFVALTTSVVGRVDVQANGLVVPLPPTVAGSTGWVSLDGISFVAHH